MPLEATSRHASPARWLNAALLTWLAAMWLVLWLRPSDLWGFHYHDWPSLARAGCLAASILVGVFVASWPQRHLSNLTVAALLGISAFATRAQPLGDYEIWTRAAADDALGASDLLTNLLYRLTYQFGGADSIAYVAPAIGVVFTFQLLRLCDTLFVADLPTGKERARRFCVLSVIAGSWHMLFSRGYIENPQLSLPLLFLAIPSIVAYSRDSRSRKALLVGSAWLGIACLAHGQHVALLPAIALITWLFAPQGRGSKQRALDALLAYAVVALTIAIGIAALWAAGYYIHIGHIYASIFVPLTDTPGLPFTLVSMEHFGVVANILALASPLTLGLPVMLAMRCGRHSTRVSELPHPSLVVLALGYCGFTFVILFLLGFPTDIDLMVNLGVVLHLALLQAFVIWITKTSKHEWIAIFLLCLGGSYAWSTTSSLTLPGGEQTLDRAQISDEAGASRPRLRANGRIRELTLRRGETLFLALPRPASANPKHHVALICEPGDVTSREASSRFHEASLFVRVPETDAEGVRSKWLVNTLEDNARRKTRARSHHVFKIKQDQLGPARTVTIQAILKGPRGGHRASNAVVVHLSAE